MEASFDTANVGAGASIGGKQNVKERPRDGRERCLVYIRSQNLSPWSLERDVNSSIGLRDYLHGL